MNKSFDVIIIGAGISGLAAAYYLLQKNPEIKIAVLDKAKTPGGKVQSLQKDDLLLEVAPDCFLSRKSGAIELCSELGILDKLIGRIPENNQTFVKYAKKLYPLPAGITGLVPTDFAAIENSELISKAGRARFSQEPLIPVLETNHDESIAEFMTRRCGVEIYEKLIEPLMAGIYGGDGEALNLAATFPKLREMEKQFGSIVTGLKSSTPASPETIPPFVSFENGMSTLIAELQKNLKRVQFFNQHDVNSIKKNNDNYQIECANQSSFQAKKIILTTPAHITAKLIQHISPTLSELHQQIPYGSSILVNFVFAKNDIPNLPKGYGYVIPRIENKNILACTWTSQKWQNRAPEDKVLMRVYMNRFNSENLLTLPDEKIIQIALEEIQETLATEAKPLETYVFRLPDSMPQYIKGHTEVIAKINEATKVHKGLYFAGAAYTGVGIPDCINSARAIAKSN